MNYIWLVRPLRNEKLELEDGSYEETCVYLKWVAAKIIAKIEHLNHFPTFYLEFAAALNFHPNSKGPKILNRLV